jgi:hypothetical protein
MVRTLGRYNEKTIKLWHNSHVTLDTNLLKRHKIYLGLAKSLFDARASICCLDRNEPKVDYSA